MNGLPGRSVKAQQAKQVTESRCLANHQAHTKVALRAALCKWVNVSATNARCAGMEAYAAGAWSMTHLNGFWMSWRRTLKDQNVLEMAEELWRWRRLTTTMEKLSFNAYQGTLLESTDGQISSRCQTLTHLICCDETTPSVPSVTLMHFVRFIVLFIVGSLVQIIVEPVSETTCPAQPGEGERCVIKEVQHAAKRVQQASRVKNCYVSARSRFALFCRNQL